MATALALAEWHRGRMCRSAIRDLRIHSFPRVNAITDKGLTYPTHSKEKQLDISMVRGSRSQKFELVNRWMGNRWMEGGTPLFADFDKKWFQALRRGDEDAWEFLINSERATQIKRICKAAETENRERKFLRQVGWEDFQQECWLAILDAAQKQPEQGDVPSPGWFLRVAKLTCIGVNRRAKGTAHGMYQAADVRDESGEKKPALDLHAVDLGSLEAMDEIDRNDLIERAVGDPKQISVLKLWLEGISVAQQARDSGIPEDTLRSRLRVAVEKIRKALGVTKK